MHPRHAQGSVELALRDTPVVLLHGARQVRGVVLHDGVETVRVDPSLMSAPLAALWSGE